MKTAVFLLLTAAVGFLRAEGCFRHTLLGRCSLEHSLSPETALFDGKVSYQSPHVIWEGGTASAGCGVLLEFPLPKKISRITVVSAKPNRLAWAAERVVFQSWDSDRQRWGAENTFPDPTGHFHDREWMTAEPIETTWQPKAAVQAVRILLYGQGIWLTEVQVHDTDGAILGALPGVPISTDAAGLSPCDHGGGPSVSIAHYRTDQGYVGNPNRLCRNDRAIVNYDVRPFLAAGKVSRCVLELAMKPMGGQDCNLFALEMLAAPRIALRDMDLVASDAVPVHSFLFDRRCPEKKHVDVTDFLKSALAKGHGLIAFRLRDVTTEKVGNRLNQAEGAILDYSQTILKIEP
ncbi:MAG: hypothetical protein IJJ33_08240 [Victivallales bacterium]|nr:hypothetical protein [Victivallales bacterium]